jgi:hypothetical protein
VAGAETKGSAGKNQTRLPLVSSESDADDEDDDDDKNLAADAWIRTTVANIAGTPSRREEKKSGKRKEDGLHSEEVDDDAGDAEDAANSSREMASSDVSSKRGVGPCRVETDTLYTNQPDADVVSLSSDGEGDQSRSQRRQGASGTLSQQYVTFLFRSRRHWSSLHGQGWIAAISQVTLN